jgi:FkbM family methyltransferase
MSLIGKLFANMEVQLHPETIRFSKAWNSSEDGVAHLESEQLALTRLLINLSNKYERPFIIDVGAHVGTFSLIAALQSNLRGCAFEPLAAVCDVLRENVALNGIGSRWSVFQKALSNYPGRRILKSPHNDKESGLSCIGQTNYSNYKEEYVDVVRLDDMVSSAEIAAVDIINIDTEGCELLVLIGAAETINKHKPDLLIKVNWANINQFDLYLNNLTDYLELLGYHGHWVGPENMVFRHPYRKTKDKKPFFTDKPDASGLKVAIVKQHYDLFGPWRSEKWDLANPLSVLQKWPSRYLYFEMTHLLQADWYVLPFCHDSKNVRQRLDSHQQTIDDNMECIQHVSDIPLDDYDVVISLDPILRPPRYSKTLYAYYQNEHHHSEYTHSLHAPLPGYDLFLDHMLKGPSWVYDLPQPVAFPYLRNPEIARKICTGQRSDSVWFDKRFIMMLTHGNEAIHRGGFEDTISLLEKRMHAQVAFRHADYENVLGWGDPLDYMREMAACSYYVNLIACGAGQGLCDAASLGLICFGSSKLPYHKAICHPVCLCNDLSELEWKLTMVRGSSNLQQEIRFWQDAALSDLMVTQPLHILQAAVDMKRQRGASASIGRTSLNPIVTELTVEELPVDIARINSTKLKQRAQAEYENGSYDDALHSYRQALWFDKTDYELFYMSALAGYACRDFKSALSNVTECLKINERFRPAITLQTLLQCEDVVEDDYHKQCRARIMYLIQNRFDGYDKELDGGRIKQYNAILDELLHDYIRQRDRANQLLIQHHKLRLNRIAALFR